MAGVFARHPLAFLTEAADDICYAVVDIEDAVKLKLISFQQAKTALLPIAEKDKGFSDHSYLNDSARLIRLRASAIQVLVRACTIIFRDQITTLQAGALERPLIEYTPYASVHEGIKRSPGSKHTLATVSCRLSMRAFKLSEDCSTCSTLGYARLISLHGTTS